MIVNKSPILKFVSLFCSGHSDVLPYDRPQAWQVFTIGTYLRGPVISVGIATGCGLDGPGFESRWG
jgi:hypothetical protein